MDWANRVALVTGASSGIGRSVARDFAKRGVRVAVVARSADKLADLVTELGPDRAASFPCDVTDRVAVQALPARVKQKWGRLDIVVNNAGANHRGAFLDRTPDELLAILETNLIAPVLLTRAAIPLMETGGVVVNVASLAGKVPVPHEAAYSASKSGIRAFGRALDTEFALHGPKIRVASVMPRPRRHRVSRRRLHQGPRPRLLAADEHRGRRRGRRDRGHRGRRAGARRAGSLREDGDARVPLAPRLRRAPALDGEDRRAQQGASHRDGAGPGTLTRPGGRERSIAVIGGDVPVVRRLGP